MEVEFVLKRAEQTLAARALGQEQPGNKLLETRSELQQLQGTIGLLPSGRALQRAAAIRVQAHVLLEASLLDHLR